MRERGGGERVAFEQDVNVECGFFFFFFDMYMYVHTYEVQYSDDDVFEWFFSC